MVSIRPVTEVTESLTDAYRVLIPQLSSSSNPPTGEALQRIIESDSAQILIAEDENGENKLVGFFIGQIMKESKGKADPKSIKEVITKIISE